MNAQQEPNGRGTGRTHRQMQEAPPNAIFVWCSRDGMDYPRRLAVKIGRADLKIVPRSFDAIETASIGRHAPIILDHYFHEWQYSDDDRRIMAWVKEFNARFR